MSVTTETMTVQSTIVFLPKAQKYNAIYQCKLT